MHFSTFVTTAIILQATSALPFFGEHGREVLARAVACNDKGQIPRLFQLPPRPTDTSSKKIPDAAHPFIAPGPNDRRGPCPALNTLANHGYIDHSGVDTAENIINGAVEAVNMERDFAAFAVGLAVLARGNANIAMVSIGRSSDRVPPLPGCIDGPVAGGLATHGRFEGDVSISRIDNGLGDDAAFNQTNFNKLLDFMDLYADDGPDGPHTLLNEKVLQELKLELFHENQQIDKQLSFLAGRQLTAFSETSFMLNLMRDGRTNRTSRKQLESFFEHQTFGDDFYRRGDPADIHILGDTAAEIEAAHPIPYGFNDANGNYVIQAPPNPAFPCDGYTELASTLPGVYANTTGVLKLNADQFVDLIYKPFGELGCTKAFPSGPAGA